METVKVNTSQHVAIDYPVAGLGERVAARLIDIAIFIASFLIIMLTFSTLGHIGRGDIAFVVMVIIYGTGYVFYDLLCEIFMNGQSIGKKILKIKVISLDGAQPSLGQYLIRWVFRAVDFTLSASLGGLIAVAVSDNKQRIGDMVAGTTLIKTQQRTQLHHIAFHPVAEEYVPVFDTAGNMTDRDVELIHEVLNTYQKTANAELIYHMAGKVTTHLGLQIPNGMNELVFLKTIVMDYNYLTGKAV